ncbi:MAG: GAF domain-containing protein [Bdellovibrionales bacterium]|nr:GAF domain-containing protein [Bdellovibrionales bacterium]
MPNSRYKDIERDLASALSLIPKGRHLRDATQEFLPSVARSLGCTWAVCWVVSSDKTHLFPAHIWTSETTDLRPLVDYTKGRTLTLNEGAAGNVWRYQRPLWTVDIISTMSLPRSLVAIQEGLSGGIWFPIKADDAIYGVVELLGSEVEAPVAKFIRLMEDLGERVANRVRQPEP